MQMDMEGLMLAQQAEALRLSGAYEQAIDIFKQLEMYPNNAWVNAHLGATYYHLMDYEKAEHHLNRAIDKNDKYFWAYAQLGETYRLRAITENKQRQNYVDLAIEKFQTALKLSVNKPQEGSKCGDYAWALAHLGATYRLQITNWIGKKLNLESKLSNQEKLSGERNLEFKKELEEVKNKLEENIDEALKYLNRAIELMPTYAWAWGMRATIYRLAQDYENSFFDVEVEALTSPRIEIIQNSSSPVPLLESSRLSLYEHAFLFFYLTKKSSGDKKKIFYMRAIALLQQALILRPGDLIAKLVLIIIDTQQKKDEGKPLESNYIKTIQRKLERFFEDTEVEFCRKCRKTLRYLINLTEPSISIEQLVWIAKCAGEEHKLTDLVLKDVINNPQLDVGKTEAQLWLWQNFALREMWTYILFFLAEISHLLESKSNIGTKMPYLQLASLISYQHFIERLYQAPVFSDDDRADILKNLELNRGKI